MLEILLGSINYLFLVLFDVVSKLLNVWMWIMMFLIVYVLYVVNMIYICIFVCNVLFYWLIKICLKYNLENLVLWKFMWENNFWFDNENFKIVNVVDGKYIDCIVGGG